MKYISTQQLARMINRRPQTLRKWRCRGEGPAFVRVSPSCVLYEVRAVREWLDGLVARGVSVDGFVQKRHHDVALMRGEAA